MLCFFSWIDIYLPHCELKTSITAGKLKTFLADPLNPIGAIKFIWFDKNLGDDVALDIGKRILCYLYRIGY